MKYKVVKKNETVYMEYLAGEAPLESERDAVDLVGLCGEHDTQLLLLHGDALGERFFDLKTTIAGQMIQKLVNYYVRTAILLPAETVQKGRFGEWVSEANRGNEFRVFQSREAAEDWLTR